MFASARGHSAKTVSDLRLAAAGFAVEQFVGFGSELDCALEPASGPGSVVPEDGPAVPLWHFSPSCWLYRSLL
jgi:hypothetical protein